jgi:glycosyltransferase involved in cell wall biosynthesis
MDAGPWLPVPPAGYGGIENVVAALVPELRARGARVVLVAAPGSALEVDRLVTPLREPAFAEIAAPYNRTVGIAHAHLAGVLRTLAEEPVDVVHDHVEVVGPSVLAAAGAAVPPTLHTLHWDLGKHPDLYGAFDGGGRVWCNALSARQLARAPAALRAHVLATVPLGIDVHAVPFRADKGERALCLARICHLKGQDVAARAALRAGVPLDLAGPVGPARDARELAALGDAQHPDVAFHRAQVEPLLDGERVRWLGTLEGEEKLRVLGEARALLVPARWEEPGATAVVEALACGTPVVGLRRGALPELVDHGVTGWLADEEDELAALLRRVGELDPAACRAAAEERLTAGRMAERYLDLYEEVVERGAAARSRGRGAGALLRPR